MLMPQSSRGEAATGLFVIAWNCFKILPICSGVRDQPAPTYGSVVEVKSGEQESKKKAVAKN
jgi:hypothetical protein